MSPTIIVVAYNRLHCLKRLLLSLAEATYPSKDVRLVISIDFEDSTANKSVLDHSQNFYWPHGEKQIIRHQSNLGLKQHILTCGDLTEDFDSVIVLEDDHTVSKNFYGYAQKALSFYTDDLNIGGISLYNHVVNANNFLRFDPITEGSDIYFLQVASSRGQCWSKIQWHYFRSWLANNPVVTDKFFLPEYVKSWPNSSWLKHFNAYLSDENKYFVYPSISFSTNWGDSGTHTKASTTNFQVPLEWDKTNINLIPFAQSKIKYDSFFELTTDSLIQLNPQLSAWNPEMDIYDLKSKFRSDYVITSKASRNPIKKYELSLRPPEFNVIHGIDGDDLTLTHKNDIIKNTGITDRIYIKKHFNYFHGVLDIKTKLQNIFNIVLQKIKRN